MLGGVVERPNVAGDAISSCIKVNGYAQILYVVNVPVDITGNAINRLGYGPARVR